LKQFRHTLLLQFFIEHLIIASLLQLIQETKVLLAGQEEHLMEHFKHIIFLHILQNKEQFIHTIFLQEIFSHSFEQVKQILILHIEQTFHISFFKYKLHLFFSIKLISLLLFIIFEQSEHIDLLLFLLLLSHKVQKFLKHLIHFIPQFS
jgi:hypothetical protein